MKKLLYTLSLLTLTTTFYLYPASSEKTPTSELSQEERDSIGRFLLKQLRSMNRDRDSFDLRYPSVTPDSIKAYIDRGANVNIQDTHQSTPLFYAIEIARLDCAPLIVELLITHGADVNAQNIHGSTPLHAAAAIGNTQIVTLLLEHGAQVNTPNHRFETPLHYAVKNTFSPAIVELLLNHKANVNAKTMCEWTPLHIAAHRNYNDLRYDFDGGKQRKANATAIINFLLAYGPDVTLRSNNGYTPLELALNSECPEGAKAILQYGAKYGTYNQDEIEALLAAYPGLAALGGIEDYPIIRLKQDFKD